MKMLQTDYDYLKAKIAPLRDKLAAHRETLKTDSRVKDLDMRLRWDTLHASGATPWVCTHLYGYLNDVQIDTALRSIMAELDENPELITP